MAQDNEVQGDVIQIPQEFVLLKEEYILKLSKRLISLSMVRKHPSADYIEILDDHIDSIVGIKNKIKEVDEMIENIKQQQQPTGVDND